MRLQGYNAQKASISKTLTITVKVRTGRALYNWLCLFAPTLTSLTASWTCDPSHRWIQRRLPNLPSLTSHRRCLQWRPLCRTQFVILHPIINWLHRKNRLQWPRMVIWQEEFFYCVCVSRRETQGANLHCGWSMVCCIQYQRCKN